MNESLIHEQPQLSSDSQSASVGDNVPLPFDAVRYANEQFLCGFEGDVKSVMWCVEHALRDHRLVSCGLDPFGFTCASVSDPNDRFAATIVDFMVEGQRSASIVVTAIERDGSRLYSFESGAASEDPDEFDGPKLLFEDIQLDGNVEMIFQAVAADVSRQLNE